MFIINDIILINSPGCQDTCVPGKCDLHDQCNYMWCLDGHGIDINFNNCTGW